MKVYVVSAFSAEPYSSGHWTLSVYTSEARARALVADSLGKVYGADSEGYGGFMVSGYVECLELIND